MWEAVIFFWHVRLTKTQISLRIRAVWSKASLSPRRIFASLAIQDAPSANAQADLNLRWSHVSEGSLPDIAAQIYL